MSLEQLNGAKDLARQDPSLYPQLVAGILPIADRPETELRRWAASFVVESFIAPSLPQSVRVKLAIDVLDTLHTFIGDRDPLVQKHALTVLAIIYPVYFDYCCSHLDAATLWARVSQLKSKAVALWDDRHQGVRAACFKLAQVIVLTQSKQENSGEIEISLSSVPRNHPFIDQVMLAAECQGFLDHLLAYFSAPDIAVVPFGATLNSVLALIPHRPSLASKIVQAILHADLSRKHFRDGPESVELAVRFIEKALQLELRWVVQVNIVPQYKGAIQQYLMRVAEFKASQNLRKRAAEIESTPDSKRARTSGSEYPISGSTALPEGRIPYSALFNLVEPDNALAKFNARDLPIEIAIKVALAGLRNSNPKLVENSTKIINKRFEGTVVDVPPPPPTISGKDPEKGEVEGVFANAPNGEESAPETVSKGQIAQGPRQYSGVEATIQADNILDRIMATSGESVQVRQDAGTDQALTKVLLPEWSSKSWVYLVSRIATRGVPPGSPIAQTIREHLYNYVMEDFRGRVDVMVSWLSEEWYYCNVLAGGTNNKAEIGEESEPENENEPSEGHYFALLDRILNQMIPRLEVSDSKLVIRLVSELPELNKEMLSKFEVVGTDPERSLLAIRTIKFLLMFKPPVRDACIELATTLHTRGVAGAKAILEKYQPDALVSAGASDAVPEAVPEAPNGSTETTETA